MMQDRAIVTMAGEQKIAPKLSNGTSLKYLEWPLTQISRSRYYLTSMLQYLYVQWQTNSKS